MHQPSNDPDIDQDTATSVASDKDSQGVSVMSNLSAENTDKLEQDDQSAARNIKINGELLEKLPDDLYIPPDALEVFLETFQGPLDLLLYLIRKQNLGYSKYSGCADYQAIHGIRGIDETLSSRPGGGISGDGRDFGGD